MHSLRWSTDGSTLYSGADRGGIWRGTMEGGAWTPLSDHLYGGVHEIGVVNGPGTDPDVLIRLYGDMVHLSADDGLTWTVPEGLSNLRGTKRILVLDDAAHSVVLLVKQGLGWKLKVSTDRGASFENRRSLTSHGDAWTPRDELGSIYLVDQNRIYQSADAGATWTQLGTPIPTDIGGAAILAGSEAGAPKLYVAVSTFGGWELWSSDDSAESWELLHTLGDFWESLVASTQNPDFVAYAGVEMFVSENGGHDWEKVNAWWEYYDDPANLLHADIPGLYVEPDPAAPEGEVWYVGTDGGLYDSHDQMATVRNLSLDGLGVSQYYTVLTSRRRPELVLAGSQDQGYQRAALAESPPPPPGPWADFDQLISGDYGHLTSTDGSHDLVFSVYPGFVLVQEGEANPDLIAFLDFPAGETHLWMPYVQADPLDDNAFYLCASALWRYDRVGSSPTWSHVRHSPDDFGNGYLTAIEFSPVDPARAWAVTSQGELYYSSDSALSWTLSDDPGPGPHYFYGTTLVPSSVDAEVCWVGGSGYSNDPVFRTGDGGVHWERMSEGLPSTLVYCMVEAPDQSGAMFCGTENGAWVYDPGSSIWSDLLGNAAPINTFWACEAVPSQNLVRFGTYGRGIWDYHLETPGYFPYGELLGSPHGLRIRGVNQPLLGQSTSVRVEGCPPHARGVLLVSEAAAQAPLFGGTRLISLPPLLQIPFAADASGQAELSIRVPPNPSLLGRELYLQAGAHDPGEVENRSLSNGLRAVVGE